MLRSPFFYLALCVALAAFGFSLWARAQTRGGMPAPKDDLPLAQHSAKETAVFAGGCFWGTQSVFERVKGVVATTAGYSGGSAATATYDQVTTETTGHAESVRVVYDPSRITYGKLLQIFFSVVHDPTQLNRQGPDTGPNYRSVIFYHGPDQGKIARASKVDAETSGRFGFGKIITAIQPAGEFYRAEEYHQQYFAKRGGGRCQL